MDPKGWVNRSYESDLSLSHEIVQSFEENMGRDGYVIETGDRLPPYGHLLYSTKDNGFEDELILPETKKFYWHSGSILYENPLLLGDTCTEKFQVRKVETIEGAGKSHLVTLGCKWMSARKTAIDEERVLLLTDQIESHENIRRINFDPDWKQEVKPEQIRSIKNLNSELYGKTVSDLFSGSGNSQGKKLVIQGSPALILLLDSFRTNFESRVNDRVTYKSFGYSNDDQLYIAGSDTDAFVTSLRLVNSRNQVLFSADIRWSYSWG